MSVMSTTAAGRIATVAATLALFCLLALVYAPAAAAGCVGGLGVTCGGGGSGGGGGGSSGNDGAGGGSVPTSPSWSAGPGPYVVSYDAARDCYYVITGAGGGSYDAAMAEAAATGKPCPAFGAETPAEEAARRWREVVDLPEPEPRVDPDSSGVTGMKVYLQIEGTDWPGYSSENVELRAEPRHEVDWGDGSPAEEVPRGETGGPYPDGKVTHVYTDRGQPTITVTASWEAEWRPADGSTGWQPVEGRIQTTTGELDVTIREVQAVRQR